MLAGLLAAWLLQLHKATRLQQLTRDKFPVSCTPFQIAHFLFGIHRAYQTALVNLLTRDIIDVAGRGYRLNPVVKNALPGEENPLLPALSETVDPGANFRYSDGLAMLDQQKLQHPSFRELLVLSKQVDFQKLIIPAIVLLIGFARMFQGMANNKPVGYLVLEIGSYSLIGLMIGAQYSYTSLVFRYVEDIWRQDTKNGLGPDVLNNFTLLGTTAITGFAEYQVLSEVFGKEAPTIRPRDGSSGSGSSCASSGDSAGDGGCSSGCGGCGGGD
jgi:uncharacterized protein (TIGR04222 family)